MSIRRLVVYIEIFDIETNNAIR